MAAAHTQRPQFAKGKTQKGYVLPEKLIERIAIMALREGRRASHVVERLLLKGLEAESRESTTTTA